MCVRAYVCECAHPHVITYVSVCVCLCERVHVHRSPTAAPEVRGAQASSVNIKGQVCVMQVRLSLALH